MFFSQFRVGILKFHHCLPSEKIFLVTFGNFHYCQLPPMENYSNAHGSISIL